MFLAVAVVLTLLVVAFVLFIRPSDLPEPETPSPTAHLEHRKGVIYENLRDLTFEYRLGKLSDADYQKTKQGLQSELAAVMAEIDAAGQASRTVPVPIQDPGQARRPDLLVCPHCQARMDKPMKFCGECGKPMGAKA